MSELVDKLFAIDDSLREHGIAHAFGGAIALAYCVEEPRGTRDLDVNIFADAAHPERALGGLPTQIEAAPRHVAEVKRTGQTRLDWEGTPVDVFLNNLPLHEAVAAAVRWVPLEGREVPVIDCVSLVVFKAFFDRTRDWGDIEAVVESRPGDVEAATRTLADLVGEDDRGVLKLRALLTG